MRWYGGSIVEAVNLSKSRNTIFVVFIQGENEESRSMSTMLDLPEVSGLLEDESKFVSIRLQSGSEAYTQFAQIYQLVPVPSLFLIGGNGSPLEVLVGGQAEGAAGLVKRIQSASDAAKKTTGNKTLPQAASSSGASKAASSSFIAAEKAAEPAKAPPAEASSSSKDSASQEPSPDFETVCEGDVCIRRPKAKEETVAEAAAEAPSSTAAVSPEARRIAEAEAAAEAEEKLMLEEKIQKAKELIEMKKQEKLEEEKKLEKERELERRARGQGVAELKQWQQEQELKNLREERLRDKKANEMARAKILEQIAQDRAESMARFTPYTNDLNTSTASTSSPSAPLPSSDNSTGTITRIQFKMPDGSTHATQVEADSTFGELRNYARQNLQKSGSFTLSTVYPRRCLEEECDGESLRQLGLHPASVLLLLPGVGGATGGGDKGRVAAPNQGFFAMLQAIFFSLFVHPAQQLYTYMRSFFGGRREPSGMSTGAAPSTAQDRRGPTQSDPAVKRRRVVSNDGGGGTSVLRREGNTFRLRDRDSDDENNTWNGNSTQQM